LGVGLFSVGLLDGVARGKPQRVGGFSRFHGRRAARKLLKHGGIPILVFDLVPLEHDSTLVLLVRVIIRELTVFLNANGERSADMRDDSSLACLTRYIRPAPNDGLIPALDGTQPVPLLAQCSSGLWIGNLFRSSNGAGNAR
jgi:hypothetical protein